MEFTWKKKRLNFKTPSGTSRGVLRHKDSWIIQLKHRGKVGVGECSLIEGLSPESPSLVEGFLEEIPLHLAKGEEFLYQKYAESPAMQFAIEMAFSGIRSSHPLLHFDTAFVSQKELLSINGLIWMSSVESMFAQLDEKINLGFRCIKIKVGAIDFASECSLLNAIRKRYHKNDIEIRLDANGAFEPQNALKVLSKLSEYHIHSIEQPIATRNWIAMKKLCENTPIQIALDEELIGLTSDDIKHEMLSLIQPQYIILKPSLIGGWRGADQWINQAEKHSIGWWATSALESNIGLNAIAQWVSTKKTSMHQGLGTGELFTNNIDSPLYLEGHYMGFNQNKLSKFNVNVCL